MTRFGSWTGVMLVLAGCAPMPGVNDNGAVLNGNDNGVGQVNPPAPPATRGDLDALVGAAAAWQLFSPAMLAGGFGDHVEFVILAPGTAAPCLSIETAQVGLGFVDETVLFSGAIDDLNSSRTCTVDMAADGRVCTGDEVACPLSDPDGMVRADDQRATLPQVALARIPECRFPAETLLTLDDWAITNLHPLTLPFIQDAGRVNGVVLLEGRGRNLLRGGIAVERVGDDTVGCGTSTAPTGTTAFSGGALDIDLAFDSLDGSTCTLTFNGDAVYCAEFDPRDVDQPGAITHFIRIEGTGSWTRDDGASADVDVMYLAYTPPFIRM